MLPLSAWQSRNTLIDGVLTPARVHVQGGVIIAIEPPQMPLPSGTTLYDVGDAVLAPGIVDSHVHINEPGRTEWEGFSTATQAAAAGGITTLVDMPLNSDPVTTTVAAF